MSSRLDKVFQDATEAGLVSPAKRVDGEKLPPLLVGPLGSSLPEDGLLNYVTVDKFADVISAPAGSVILFREDQARIAEVLCRDADLFGYDVQALMGLPGAEYGRWFEEATFAREKVSYAPLISEIRMSEEVEAARAANRRDRSTHSREQARRERADGSTRYNEQIRVYDPEDQAEDDESGAGQ